MAVKRGREKNAKLYVCMDAELFFKGFLEIFKREIVRVVNKFDSEYNKYLE